MTTATAPDIQAVLRDYPLLAPAVLPRTEAGYINDNRVIIDVATSARYLLRSYSSIRDEDRLRFQLSFQEHLRASGFPVAPIVRTKGGDAFTKQNGTYWALFGFVDGYEYDFASLAQTHEAGRRLAQFSVVANSYCGPAVEPYFDSSLWSAPLSTHISRAIMLSDDHEARLTARYSDPKYVDDLDFFSRWRCEARQVWPPERLSALPVSWLHCDYHGRNMVFLGDGLAALLDFDFVVRGPRAYDVGRALFVFARERRGSTTLRPEFCRAFLEGFESEQPLTDEELRSLAYMAVLNWVPDTPFDAARHGADEDAGTRFRHCIQMMRTTQDQMRRLAPEFGWETI